MSYNLSLVVYDRSTSKCRKGDNAKYFINSNFEKLHRLGWRQIIFTPNYNVILLTYGLEKSDYRLAKNKVHKSHPKRSEIELTAMYMKFRQKLEKVISHGKTSKKAKARGVDVIKRTVTTHSYSLLDLATTYIGHIVA